MAAKVAVIVPTSAMMSSTTSLNSGKMVLNKNTPAATIVAACMSDETEVGPSIASGSHRCSGN